jgi:acyl transferase domain-containing protein
MGVMPDTVLGHSLGEIVAACFAGIINTKTALQIVHSRGKSINIVAGTGTMWVVGVSKEYYNVHYTDKFQGIEIAAVNGMETIVLSGTETELQQLAVLLDGVGIFNKRTQINYASHSKYIEPALETFRKGMPDYIPAASARCKVFSTSKVAYTEPSNLTKEYWIENLQSTVCFKEALEALIEENDIAGIEISSHSLLGTLAEGITDDKEHIAVWVNSCLKDQSEVQTFSTALSRVYTLGVDINWDSWYIGQGSKKIEVPRYIYNKKEYWIGVQVATVIQSAAAKNEVSKQQYEGLDWNDLLKVLIAEITYLPQAGIGVESSFRDIGLDSLMILKLRKRIETIKGIEVKTTVFWNYPNIRLLSIYLSKQNIVPSDDKLQEKIDTRNIADLSDDDINSALDKIIAQTL